MNPAWYSSSGELHDRLGGDPDRAVQALLHLERVEWERGVAVRRPAALPRHRRRPGALRLAKQRLGQRAVEQATARPLELRSQGSRRAGHVRTHPGGVRAARRSASRLVDEDDLPEWLGDVRVDVPLALDDEPQRRELARPDAQDRRFPVLAAGEPDVVVLDEEGVEAREAGAEAEVKLTARRRRAPRSRSVRVAFGGRASRRRGPARRTARGGSGRGFRRAARR